MSTNRIICRCNNIDYLSIRKLMVMGVRTLDEVKNQCEAGTVCGSCENEIEDILSSVCGCKNVSLKDVVCAVKLGADTIEKVSEVTGAGTDCERCKMLIKDIVQRGR